MTKRKTGNQVRSDFVKIIANSPIKTAISGDIYKGDGDRSTRPLNSKKEDVIVVFTAGLDGQIQDGVVMVNIYVPDIDSGAGVMLENSSRCEKLEGIANEFVQSIIPNEYLITLQKMIQTFSASEIDQHYVNIPLKFRLITI